MARWNNELKVSRHTRLFSSSTHGGIALAALLVHKPVNSTYFWFPLLILFLTTIIVSWMQSQKNIQQCQGRLVLFGSNNIHWQKTVWGIVQPPWFSRYGMILYLHVFDRTGNTCNQPKIRLWLASDSMSPEAWRHLNQLMRQYPDI
ncbi:hypothetical protein HZS38_10695 [Xenorhabdus nematophila]|uniref:protein YgfX n=1 Tax=Xenorhabdus nematophila TaxID=628 RepID=UPI0005429739|nr:protein YgfX [Xenorhabdus nematophila]CEF30786.1 conserved hypothetical protein [Xenorhabdus nematophila str. Websteri]AYA40837.1 hypothetical protein D3790_10630 [Xenorhabdus nematophila]KHD28610.1 hypothetical protein LH67_09470 [Xenorhabdus nematophila]MBA0019589.1 hypothetical protein [Xenorhabdus nematophila]MCB4423945.1 hypothetical protein [Xenorhabdus nematophila]